MSLIARLLILSATMTVLISETSAQRGAPPSLPDGAGTVSYTHLTLPTIYSV